MIGDSSPLAAALGVVLVTGLSLLSVLCLRCKNKSKIIHEEHQIYNLQTFQRGGSVFAVTQSKTVTRPNQITSVAADRREKFGDSATEEMDDQPDYQNISNGKLARSLAHTHTHTHKMCAATFKSVIFHVASVLLKTAQTGRAEHTYVAALAGSVYENELDATTDADPGVYANIQPPSPPSSTYEEDDYENSEFLEKVVEEPNDDEPDYVNERGT
ncbi:uncharacterized protein AB9W97_010117 isoform 1-T1 [Spinachia spinachia]